MSRWLYSWPHDRPRRVLESIRRGEVISASLSRRSGGWRRSHLIRAFYCWYARSSSAGIRNG
ncbi:hypothetical protein KCP69_10695 [Salmonella enterica subsp. enterica]|nr:hypothetical protein KCP69_10695 [Salmonella enterica subsp. enterica]